MQVYIASNRENIDKVRYWQQRLITLGIKISYDWTKDVAGAKPESQLDLIDQQDFASTDLNGVSIADVVWLICPRVGGTGCFIELGYALACGEKQLRDKRIMISGELERSIFLSLADFRSNSDDLVFEQIVRLFHGHG